MGQGIASRANECGAGMQVAVSKPLFEEDRLILPQG
jgi:hypothetical protein